jgi:hypothetical protein
MRTGKLKPYGNVGDVAYYKSQKIVSKQVRLRFRVSARDFLKVIGGFKVEWRDELLKSQ